MFGGSAFVKEHIFHLHDYNKATFFQNFCASIGGAVSSITVAAPLDVVKTRIQNRNFENPESGFKIVKDLVKNEGPSAFFKGLTPKILVVWTTRKDGIHIKYMNAHFLYLRLVPS